MSLIYLNISLLPIDVANTKSALNMYESPVMTTISLNINITFISKYKVTFLVDTFESNPKTF